MSRLNQRAFEILQAEIQRSGTNDLAGKVQQEIALRRLEKLAAASGLPADEAELREMLIDLFPNFNPQVLKAAARANRAAVRRSPKFTLLAGVLLAATGMAGVIWLLNLPNPYLRRTVAQIAPELLTPSFMSMDYNYRQAIALVEQSDQLVNQATSAADLELGTTRVKAAQKHLDALPVWFLGYYPQRYCSWFQCGWQFTFDEFEQARKAIARMDARLFQEKNAQTQLNQAEQALGNAKQQYQEAPNPVEQQAAIAQWQQAIDTLHQIPAATLAGRMTQPKLTAAERDFQQVVGFTAGNARSGNLIQAAAGFAKYAEAATAQSKTHSVAEWEKIQQHWQDAIDRLQKIDEKDADYNKAQALLAQYQDRFRSAEVSLKQEQTAVESYEAAQRLIEQWQHNRSISQIQPIIHQLNKVKPGTTVYQDAQELMGYAKRYQQRQQ
jgi:hypothetical protein